MSSCSVCFCYRRCLQDDDNPPVDNPVTRCSRVQAQQIVLHLRVLFLLPAPAFFFASTADGEWGILS